LSLRPKRFRADNRGCGMSPPAFGISPSNRAYGLIMPDDSMAPLYEPGDTVVADPQREITPGKTIVVWFKNQEGRR
jgi:SOS-response transcriptional repressor LexA